MPISKLFPELMKTLLEYCHVDAVTIDLDRAFPLLMILLEKKCCRASNPRFHFKQLKLVASGDVRMSKKVDGSKS